MRPCSCSIGRGCACRILDPAILMVKPAEDGLSSELAEPLHLSTARWILPQGADAFGVRCSSRRSRQGCGADAHVAMPRFICCNLAGVEGERGALAVNLLIKIWAGCAGDRYCILDGVAMEVKNNRYDHSRNGGTLPRSCWSVLPERAPARSGLAPLPPRRRRFWRWCPGPRKYRQSRHCRCPTRRAAPLSPRSIGRRPEHDCRCVGRCRRADNAHSEGDQFLRGRCSSLLNGKLEDFEMTSRFEKRPSAAMTSSVIPSPANLCPATDTQFVVVDGVGRKDSAQVGLAEGDDVRFVAERRTQVTIQFRSKPRVWSSARSSRRCSQRTVTPEECAQSQPASCRHGTKP